MRASLALIPLFACACAAGSPAAGKVGALAPPFTLEDTEGQQVALSGLLEKGPVILAFFPRAFTAG